MQPHAVALVLALLLMCVVLMPKGKATSTPETAVSAPTPSHAVHTSPPRSTPSPVNIEDTIETYDKLIRDIDQVLEERAATTPPTLQRPIQLPVKLQGAPRTFVSSVGPRSSMNDLLSGPVACDLILWKQGNCFIDEENETVADCLARVGARQMAKVTPERCRESDAFRDAVRAEEAVHGILQDSSWHNLRRTYEYNQQVIKPNFVKEYVPPHKRPKHSYKTGPRVCNEPNSPAKGCVMHPIGFHIPRNQVVPKVVRRKLFDFLPFIPRPFPISDHSPSYTLGVNDEYLSNILHEHSYLAFTHRRGGWDCLRHLEIMASGCVPYFPDMVACGKFCMTQMPKDLLAQVAHLPGLAHIGMLPSMDTQSYSTDFVVLSETTTDISKVDPRKLMNFKTQGTIDWSSFDEERYFELAEKLHNFTLSYLTTQSLATYMLETINYPEPKHVLILTGTIYRYLIQSVVHGFYDLGIHFTVYPLDEATVQLTEHWNEETQTSEPLSEEELEARRYEFRLWQGLLYGYGMRVTPSERPPPEAEIIRRIKSGFYDLVVYPWTVHRAANEAPVFTKDKPFWSHVSAALPPDRIIFVDTTDDVFRDPDDVLFDMCGKGVIFRRSLHDHKC